MKTFWENSINAAQIRAFGLGLFLVIATGACTNTPNVSNPVANPPASAKVPTLPATPYNYANIALPAHLTTNALGGIDQASALGSDNTPASNSITDNSATLGRVLFYDKNLSANSTVSCGSCHKQKEGFSDKERLSKGFMGGLTRRHSMSLANARFYKRGRFFWDERAATLEEQVLMPFQDKTEMGMTLAQVVERVQGQDYYKQLFTNAFGSNEITSDKISRALAQFIRSMVSVSSKYDSGRVAVPQPVRDFANFTASENSGKRLFFLPQPQGGLGCIGCHASEAFINPVPGTTSNGIDSVSTTDKGVAEAINFDRFIGTFKVPSLKNIALTAPYMHDGRFATLEEVIEHYNSGVKNHPNLGIALKEGNMPNGKPLKFNLSAQQKADLLAFLRTLTDNQMITDPKYSDPFR
ncbi:MAG: cytochrome-c peroxidase [Candidatus Kapaibacterium sp.]|nr:MAG: cytochrome-c peroxidase [Candidatus Kapabacteria bacterium]